METLDYNQMLLVSLWQYNHHGDEELTPALFEETFGKVDVTLWIWKVTTGWILPAMCNMPYQKQKPMQQ